MMPTLLKTHLGLSPASEITQDQRVKEKIKCFFQKQFKTLEWDETISFREKNTLEYSRSYILQYVLSMNNIIRDIPDRHSGIL